MSKLNAEDEDQKFVILQSLVEKILNYLLTTIETTETRIANLTMGVTNVTQFITQQINDLTGRLKLLPGLENLKDMPLPPNAQASATPTSESFYNHLKQFIENKAIELMMKKATLASGTGAIEPLETKDMPEDEIPYTDDFGAYLDEKERKVTEKEHYLQALADQLAAKELQLQERESTIEVIESSLTDNLKLSAAMQMVGISKTDKKSESDSFDESLAELSQLSDSIVQGDGGDGLDDDNSQNSDDPANGKDGK